MQLMSPQRKLWGGRVPPCHPRDWRPWGYGSPKSGVSHWLWMSLITVLRTNVLHCDQGSERYDSEWWCNSKIEKSKVKVYWERKCIIVFAQIFVKSGSIYVKASSTRMLSVVLSFPVVIEMITGLFCTIFKYFSSAEMFHFSDNL